MNDLVRPDLIFSYWIFIWFILYMLDIVQYNPKFALSFALIFNIFQIGLMIYYKNKWLLIVIFSFVTFLIKGIPAWILRNNAYDMKQVLYICILFFMYIIWLIVNGTNPYNIMKATYNAIKHNKPFGPFSYFLNHLTK